MSLVWSQAGVSLQLDTAGYWFAAIPKQQWPEDEETRRWVESRWDDEVGDARQEIVFIGIEMDRAAIEQTLDDALLTNDEMRAGPGAWSRYPDPLTTHADA